MRGAHLPSTAPRSRAAALRLLRVPGVRRQVRAPSRGAGAGPHEPRHAVGPGSPGTGFSESLVFFFIQKWVALFRHTIKCVFEVYLCLFVSILFSHFLRVDVACFVERQEQMGTHTHIHAHTRTPRAHAYTYTHTTHTRARIHTYTRTQHTHFLSLSLSHRERDLHTFACK